MTKAAPSPADIEAMRKAVADADAAAAAEIDAKAVEAVKPARDLIDELAGIKDFRKHIEDARLATARFSSLSSVIESIGKMIDILPDFVARAEDQARGEFRAQAQQQEE